MQRKINRYWRRKESSKETLSATTSKVQITVSDIDAQNMAQWVTPNQRNKNKLIPFYFNKLVQLFIQPQQDEDFQRKNSWMYCILLTEK